MTTLKIRLTHYIWRTCSILVKIDTWWHFFWNTFHFSRLSLSKMHMHSQIYIYICGTGQLENFTISVLTLDQLYVSQPGWACFLGAALWFLLFLRVDVFHSFDWSHVNNHSTCFGHLCKFLYYTLHTTIYSHHPVDCLFAVSPSCHQTRQIYPYTVIDHDCGCLWCSSPGLYLETEVGYGRLDNLLYFCNLSILLFLPLYYLFWRMDDFSWGQTHVVHPVH